MGFGYTDPLAVQTTIVSHFKTPCALVADYKGQPGVVILALSGAELVHNMDRLDGAKVCVFDRPDKLSRLPAVQPVDFLWEDEVYRCKRFPITALDPEKFPQPQRIVLSGLPRDIFQSMLETSDNGVLNGILTFLYTIKNTKVRKDISETIYPWFFLRERSMDWLFDQLETRFPNVDFSSIAELFVVKAELIEDIRAAADTYSLSLHPDFRAFCEQQGVPFYDLHYLVKVVRSKSSSTTTPEA